MNYHMEVFSALTYAIESHYCFGKLAAYKAWLDLSLAQLSPNLFL